MSSAIEQNPVFPKELEDIKFRIDTIITNDLEKKGLELLDLLKQKFSNLSKILSPIKELLDEYSHSEHSPCFLPEGSALVINLPVSADSEDRLKIAFVKDLTEEQKSFEKVYGVFQKLFSDSYFKFNLKDSYFTALWRATSSP